jgi:hypothetical protein
MEKAAWPNHLIFVPCAVAGLTNPNDKMSRTTDDLPAIFKFIRSRYMNPASNQDVFGPVDYLVVSLGALIPHFFMDLNW